jgi:hypothetical protein
MLQGAAQMPHTTFLADGCVDIYIDNNCIENMIRP